MGLRIHPTPPALALIHACTLGDTTEVLRLLVEERANVNTQTSSGTTPAHIATSMGYEALLEELIKRGADLDMRENPEAGGCTPLHHAVERGNTVIASILLKHEADPNIAESTLKFTPLHLAARAGNTAMVALLLDEGIGIDAEQRDRHGQNASYWARQLGHTAVLRVSGMPPAVCWTAEERMAAIREEAAKMSAGAPPKAAKGKKGKKGKGKGKKKGKKKK